MSTKTPNLSLSIDPIKRNHARNRSFLVSRSDALVHGNKDSGNLAIMSTKRNYVDLYGGTHHAVYRDTNHSIIISPKRLVIRPNMSRLSKGMFCYEYIYHEGEQSVHIRNIARHIPLTDSESFELKLTGKVIEVDQDECMLYVKDIYPFLEMGGYLGKLSKLTEHYGMTEVYND